MSTPIGDLSSDEQSLVARAQKRDLGAFEQLVDRYQDRLYGVAKRLLHNDSDAQEVLQEALVLAWRNLPSFEGRAQISSWLHRVVVNAALMMLRSRRRRPTVSMDEMSPGERDAAVASAAEGPGFGAANNWAKRPDEDLQSRELFRSIENAVDELPEALRVAFILRDVEGLSTEEAAHALGIGVPAVKTRLHRARLAVRGAIGEYFDSH